MQGWENENKGIKNELEDNIEKVLGLRYVLFGGRNCIIFKICWNSSIFLTERLIGFFLNHVFLYYILIKIYFIKGANYISFKQTFYLIYFILIIRPFYFNYSTMFFFLTYRSIYLFDHFILFYLSSHFILFIIFFLPFRSFYFIYPVISFNYFTLLFYFSRHYITIY